MKQGKQKFSNGPLELHHKTSETMVYTFGCKEISGHKSHNSVHIKP